MYRAEDLEVWNLSPRGTVVNGAQRIFNVLGRVKDPRAMATLAYALNGGQRRHAFFTRSDGNRRLHTSGDFNIDTIDSTELADENRLELVLTDQTGREQVCALDFDVTRAATDRAFRLDVDEAAGAEQVAQVVDGRWQVGDDGTGRRALFIADEDAGYDRIALFGKEDWTTGYEVSAHLRARRWFGSVHNVGLLFKWNPHLQGDGTELPWQWSTGLAYYYSKSPGLRLRFGVDVRLDEHGEKLGDHVLAEAPLSWLRKDRPWLDKLRRRALGRDEPMAQVRAGVDYRFRLVVSPEEYTLAVWEADRAEPAPQLRVAHPDEHLARGAVGVIAHNCAVSVYEYEVTPRG